MQGVTLGADVAGLNINTGGQDKRWESSTCILIHLDRSWILTRNFGDLSADRFVEDLGQRMPIIKAADIDSPYMDEQLRRNFQPMTPPSAGPQLFPIRRVQGLEWKLHKVYLMKEVFQCKDRHSQRLP